MQLLQILNRVGKLSLHGKVALGIKPTNDVVCVSHIYPVAIRSSERHEQSRKQHDRKRTRSQTQNLVLGDGHGQRATPGITDHAPMLFDMALRRIAGGSVHPLVGNESW